MLPAEVTRFRKVADVNAEYNDSFLAFGWNKTDHWPLFASTCLHLAGCVILSRASRRLTCAHAQSVSMRVRLCGKPMTIAQKADCRAGTSRIGLKLSAFLSC